MLRRIQRRSSKETEAFVGICRAGSHPLFRKGRETKDGAAESQSVLSQRPRRFDCAQGRLCSLTRTRTGHPAGKSEVRSQIAEIRTGARAGA